MLIKEVLNLTNDVALVPEMAVWVETMADRIGIPMDKVFSINLALEEAVVNVMKYAYPGKTGEPVILSVEWGDGDVVFRIEDMGAEFDPTAAAPPDLELSAEDRPIGGLGIFLVKELMSDVNYERKDGKNILTMVV